MSTWAQDLHRMANDMDHVVTDVEGAGFDPDEYADIGFPEEHRQEIVAVMDRWNFACGDLAHAANEMIALAERITPKDTKATPPA